MTVELALDMAEAGYTVFPVLHTKDNEKKPLTRNGHKDATRDPGVIMEWWAENPNAKVGVPAGANNIVVLDVDTKHGVDGYTTIDDNWLPLPDTYHYDTSTGGRHFVYLAPEGVTLNGQAPYRKLPGVDRRGGESWVLWVGGVPDSEIAPAPEWLCDPAVTKRQFNFDGELEEWFDSLVPGEPNVLVRKAIERIAPDMGHSDMVEAQHAALRLGAEGNAGVQELLEAIREAWLSRPAENHTTPESEWGFKFQEALASGLEKYGALTEQLKNLPEYNLGLVPTGIPDKLLLEPNGKTGFSALLGALIREVDSDERVASILWNCAATKELARDWGLQFVFQRVTEARSKPEPTRENPRIEEQREEAAKPKPKGLDGTELLTPEERDFLSTRPTFVDYYLAAGKSTGFANEKYFKAAAWVVAGMAFSFHGYIPVTATDRIGLNVWNMVLGYSGTGKTRAIKFRDLCLGQLFKNDNPDGVSYNLGTDSSVAGLHEALLGRDKKASFFGADEASGFFKQLARSDWMTSLDDTLSRWYEGDIDPSNKVRLKELKGKSAQTALTTQMFATPDRLTEVLTRDMFLTGYLARFQWIIGDPPVMTDDRFNLLQQAQGEVEDFDDTPGIITDVVTNLIEARSFTNGKAVPLFATDEALKRMSDAYRRMFRIAEQRKNFDLTEPSVTRLMEVMRKCAGICAMYRSDTNIILEDALHAIAAVEEWFEGLFEAAETISSGEFQRDCNEIEIWVRKKGGRVTKTALYHNFRNMIQRSPQELDLRIGFLVDSGALNRLEDKGTMRYEVNG